MYSNSDCRRRGAVAIRTSEVVRYGGGGGLIYSVKCKNVFVSEVMSAIWNESAIRGIRYRRFHCN